MLPAVAMGADVFGVFLDSLAGLFLGLVGVLFGWVAWWGPVEPLPLTPMEELVEASPEQQSVPCGICSGVVESRVLMQCQYGCGRAFHQGCYQARVAVSRNSGTECGVCGQGLT